MNSIGNHPAPMSQRWISLIERMALFYCKLNLQIMVSGYKFSSALATLTPPCRCSVLPTDYCSAEHPAADSCKHCEVAAGSLAGKTARN